MNDVFQPACLPKNPILKAGTPCYVAGIKDGSMKTTPMKILSKDECHKLIPNEYDEFDKDFEISKWNICVMNPTNEVWSVNIGSPLICKEDGKAVVYGVASIISNSIHFIIQKRSFKNHKE